MHIIVYSSEYTADNESIDNVLADIVTTAKANNPERGISGLLFYHNNRFLQIIEGEKDALEQLMSILENDNRHTKIERIMDQAIKKRGFEKWNMDVLNLPGDESIAVEELESIRDAYTKNLEVDSELLAYFYKTFLESRVMATRRND